MPLVYALFLSDADGNVIPASEEEDDFLVAFTNVTVDENNNFMGWASFELSDGCCTGKCNHQRYR